jgi:hypothetical protein
MTDGLFRGNNIETAPCAQNLIQINVIPASNGGLFNLNHFRLWRRTEQPLRSLENFMRDGFFAPDLPL